MTVKIKSITLVTFCTNILCSWTLLTVGLITGHYTWILYNFVTSKTGQTFSFWITSSTILNFTFVLNTTQCVIGINQIESRFTFRTRLIVFTYITIFNLTISFTCKVSINFVSVMTSFTSTIYDWFTVWNRWNFTNLFREIQCISKNTSLTITNVIFTFCTISVVTLCTCLGTIFVGDEISRFAFWTITIFYTNITIFYRAFFLFSLLPSQKDLRSNATIVICVSTDVSKSTKSPTWTPWILNNPLSFSITN